MISRRDATPAETPRIRRATRTDLASVWRLLEDWKPGRHLTANDFISSRGSRGNFLLALWGDEPAGVLEGHHQWTNWELLSDWQHLGGAERGSYLISLYVAPQFRSRGIGSGLVAAFIEEAIDAGSPLVLTIPDEDPNQRDARREFFAQRGFAPIGVTMPQPTWIWGRNLSG